VHISYPSMCTAVHLLQIVDAMAFPIDTGDREQMLKILNSCIGTKYTARFGTLMAVSAVQLALPAVSLLVACDQPSGIMATATAAAWSSTLLLF
jgi:hypothetical protein